MLVENAATRNCCGGPADAPCSCGQPNYLGAGAGGFNRVDNDSRPTPLPVYNWDFEAIAAEQNSPKAAVANASSEVVASRVIGRTSGYPTENADDDRPTPLPQYQWNW